MAFEKVAGVVRSAHLEHLTNCLLKFLLLNRHLSLLLGLLLDIERYWLLGWSIRACAAILSYWVEHRGLLSLLSENSWLLALRAKYLILLLLLLLSKACLLLSKSLDLLFAEARVVWLLKHF